MPLQPHKQADGPNEAFRSLCRRPLLFPLCLNSFLLAMFSLSLPKFSSTLPLAYTYSSFLSVLPSACFLFPFLSLSLTQPQAETQTSARTHKQPHILTERTSERLCQEAVDQTLSSVEPQPQGGKYASTLYGYDGVALSGGVFEARVCTIGGLHIKGEGQESNCTH
ncbi:unnamed protein product [Protopolystoma xenopodis]|uniref:Uncharacterized protein n=1 Tax=Protopolystoma xenopodis TaxID=117903 RepID=A0A448WD35_9PLAT|nr:unnamed protein product [Protopolystoma xenopodis]